MKALFNKIPLVVAYVIAGTILIGSILGVVAYLLFTSNIEF